MRNMMAIAQREVKAYFASPIAYILIGFFALLFGYFYYALLSFFERQSMQMGMGGGPQTMNVNQMLISPLLVNATVILLFVFPLIIGMAIGRIGCFLTGLADHTYGVATSLPWGIDFGDGIRRHPTQLYEIVFLLALGSVLLVVRRRLTESGDLFKLFMVAYLGWRFAIGFIQLEIPLAGLSAIQWACLATLIYYAALSRKRFVLSRAEPAMRTHG